jgi:hypothetical protein
MNLELEQAISKHLHYVNDEMMDSLAGIRSFRDSIYDIMIEC